MTTIVQQQQHPPPPLHHHIPQTQILPGPSSYKHSTPLPSQSSHPQTSSNTRPILSGPSQQLAPSPANPLPPVGHPTSSHNPYQSPSQTNQRIPSPIAPPNGVLPKDVDQLEQPANPPLSSIERKRPRPLMTEASVAPAYDKSEWYYPAAPRPAAAAGDDDEPTLAAGSSNGNWGRKHVKGARWVSRGKLSDWGAGRSDWDTEERARKRLKAILPSVTSRSQSPPLPVLPHLRSPSPPLTAPYAVPPKTHPSYTSFILDHGVQHTYRNRTLESLESTMTEFIEGEGALRMALGGFWRSMGSNSDLTYQKVEPSANSSDKHSNGHDNADSVKQSIEPTLDGGPGDEDASLNEDSAVAPVKSSEELLVASLSPLRQLFVSTSPVLIGPDQGPRTTLHSASQLESFEWAMNMLRDLSDDGREYMTRLEEVRGECGIVRGVRKEVWSIIREKALEEMQDEEKTREQEEAEEEEGGSEY